MSQIPWDVEPDVPLVSKEEFLSGRRVRYGMSNPELMNVPFWKMMIQNRLQAYDATNTYEADVLEGGPTWCFARFGMTSTVWRDRWVVSIGGEHEDFYDPDFQIYNDVIVRDFHGGIWIYGYPEDVFPPTDFHSATLIHSFRDHDLGWQVPTTFTKSIVIIGGLGYKDSRDPTRTPVYKLCLRTMAIESVEVEGTAPGWIFRHHATAFEPSKIVVWGGERYTEEGQIAPNHVQATLDLQSLRWEIACD